WEQVGIGDIGKRHIRRIERLARNFGAGVITRNGLAHIADRRGSSRIDHLQPSSSAACSNARTRVDWPSAILKALWARGLASANAARAAASATVSVGTF